MRPKSGKIITASIYGGFSLVELLVVIGIITVLIAILLPTLAAARVSGMQTQSASNLRQIGIALRMYADENRGRFPETTHGGPPDRSWVFTLAPYFGNVDRVRVCPADPRSGVLLLNNGTSYILNEYIAVPRMDAFGNVLEDFTRLDKLRRPSDIFTVFVASDRLAPGVFADHTHSRNWVRNPMAQSWTRVLSDIQPDRFTTRVNSPLRDRGSSVYLFADTHVENRRAADMRKLILDGINFAKPSAP